MCWWAPARICLRLHPSSTSHQPFKFRSFILQPSNYLDGQVDEPGRQHIHPQHQVFLFEVSKCRNGAKQDLFLLWKLFMHAWIHHINVSPPHNPLAVWWAWFSGAINLNLSRVDRNESAHTFSFHLCVSHYYFQIMHVRSNFLNVFLVLIHWPKSQAAARRRSAPKPYSARWNSKCCEWLCAK